MKNKFIKLFSKKSKRITKSYTYDEIKELFYKFVSKSTDEKNHNQTMGLNYQEEKYKYLYLLQLMKKDAINKIISTTLSKDGFPLSKYNEQINTCEDFLRNPKYQIDNYIGRFSLKFVDGSQLIIKERKNGKHDIEYMDAFLRKLVRTTKYRLREATEQMLNLIEKEFTDSNSFSFNKSQTDKVFDEFIDNPLLKFLIDMRFNLLNDKTSENSKLRFDIRIPKDKNPTHFI